MWSLNSYKSWHKRKDPTKLNYEVNVGILGNKYVPKLDSIQKASVNPWRCYASTLQIAQETENET